MLGVWFQHIHTNFVILHAQNACQVSNVHANPEKNICSLRVLRRTPTNCLGTRSCMRALRAGASLADNARPVIHSVAAAQTNPRLRLIGVLHGLCGDAGASALVHQRL